MTDNTTNITEFDEQTFVETWLPNYYQDDRIAECDDLACLIDQDGEQEKLDRLAEYYGEDDPKQLYDALWAECLRDAMDNYLRTNYPPTAPDGGEPKKATKTEGKFTQARQFAAEVASMVKGMTFDEALQAIRDRYDYGVIRTQGNYVDFNYKGISMSMYDNGGLATLGRCVEWWDDWGMQIYVLPLADTIESNGKCYRCAHVMMDDGRQYIVADNRLYDDIEAKVERGEDTADDHIGFYVPREMFDDLFGLLEYLNEELAD